MLTRPNKAKTASMAANILSSIFVVVIGLIPLQLSPPLCTFCGFNVPFHPACTFLATSQKCSIFTSLVILFVGTLSSGVRYAMLMRPNKAKTVVHTYGCNILSSNFAFFDSYRVNSLHHCRLCALSCGYNFPFNSAWGRGRVWVTKHARKKGKEQHPIPIESFSKKRHGLISSAKNFRRSKKKKKKKRCGHSSSENQEPISWCGPIICSFPLRVAQKVVMG